MTENEALESALKKIIAQEKSNWGYIENFDVDENWAVRTAIEHVKQYRKIGTPEECRAAVEQQIPKRPTLCKSDEQTTRYTADYRCPKCNGMFTGTGIANYCYHCGQRLDWEELT